MAIWACTTSPEPEPGSAYAGVDDATAAGIPLTLLAVGDVMNHLAVERSAERSDEGFSALFSEVRDTIASADVAFANLETPVARRGIIGDRVFNAPPALLDALYRSGFDVVSTANNHAYDQGTEGLLDTVRAVQDHAMTPVGAGGNCGLAHAPRILVRQGVRIAWFAATEILNVDLNRGMDEPCVATLDLSRLQRDVAKVRTFTDLVVVSVHWGEEYVSEPSDAQLDAAHRLVEAGADLVLGHHSHVISPIEQIHARDGHTGWVAYGLGNFISNQSAWYRHGVHSPDRGDPRDGLMLQVEIRHEPGDTRITRVRPMALWAENTTLVGARDTTSPMIQVIPVEARLASLEARLRAEQEAGRDLERSPTVAHELRQQISLLRDRLQIVADRTTLLRRRSTTTRGASTKRSRAIPRPR